MLTEEEVIELAKQFVAKKYHNAYKFGNAEFLDYTLEKYLPYFAGRKSEWIVRFDLIKKPVGSVKDDGDILYALRIDPDTKKITVCKGMQS